MLKNLRPRCQGPAEGNVFTIPSFFILLFFLDVIILYPSFLLTLWFDEDLGVTRRNKYGVKPDFLCLLLILKSLQ